MDDFIPSECNECGLLNSAEKTCEESLESKNYTRDMYNVKAIADQFGFDYSSYSNIIFT